MDATRRYAALGAAAVLAVLAVGWFLLVSPQRGQVQQLRDAAAEQTAQADSLTTRLATLRSQARQLPAQRDRLAAVEARIPAAPAVPDLVRSLSDAATASGATLVSLTPGTPAAAGAAASSTPPGGTAAPAAGTLQVLPVTINVFGDYPQLQRYLAALEELPRALRVTDLAMAPGADPGATSTSGADPTDGRSLLAAVTAQVYLTGGSRTGGSRTGDVQTGGVQTGSSAAPASGAPAPVTEGNAR